MANETKLLKARCKVSGKKFVFDMRRNGDHYEAVNMVEVNDEDYSHVQSEIKAERYVTAASLQKDEADGKRIIGGYGYPKSKRFVCTRSMPYYFPCCYCNQIEFDYGGKAVRSPYGKWAGISQIPGADKDVYGNPSGSEFDLANDGAFSGYKVIILNFAALTRRDARLEKVTEGLKKKGFEVIELRSNSLMEGRLFEYLRSQEVDKTQVWVISSTSPILSLKARNALISYYKEGHGLYLLGDDFPCLVEADVLLKSIFPGARMGGEYKGKQMLSESADLALPGIISNHPVTTGIIRFYEGTTVAGITLGSGLAPLIRGSDNEILACYSIEEGRRLIADGGFTRLYAGWEQAGNERYFVNVAAYLANIERFGFGA